MNSITATYPGFQSLPKGIRQMLVVSESVFFDDARGPGTALIGHAPGEAAHFTHLREPSARSYPAAWTVKSWPQLQPGKA